MLCSLLEKKKKEKKENNDIHRERNIMQQANKHMMGGSSSGKPKYNHPITQASFHIALKSKIERKEKGIRMGPTPAQREGGHTGKFTRGMA